MYLPYRRLFLFNQIYVFSRFLCFDSLEDLQRNTDIYPAKYVIYYLPCSYAAKCSHVTKLLWVKCNHDTLWLLKGANSLLVPLCPSLFFSSFHLGCSHDDRSFSSLCRPWGDLENGSYLLNKIEQKDRISVNSWQLLEATITILHSYFWISVT